MLEFREPLFLWISLLSIPLFFVMLRREGVGFGFRVCRCGR